jgi:hypothetical protein
MSSWFAFLKGEVFVARTAANAHDEWYFDFDGLLGVLQADRVTGTGGARSPVWPLADLCATPDWDGQTNTLAIQVGYNGRHECWSLAVSWDREDRERMRRQWRELLEQQLPAIEAAFDRLRHGVCDACTGSGWRLDQDDFRPCLVCAAGEEAAAQQKRMARRARERVMSEHINELYSAVQRTFERYDEGEIEVTQTERELFTASIKYICAVSLEEASS